MEKIIKNLEKRHNENFNIQFRFTLVSHIRDDILGLGITK